MVRRIPQLDGIRGIAILAVVAHHYLQAPESAPFQGIWWARLARPGWIGVDLFFVLSGFLLGGILLDSRGESNYFRSFYARRAGRILPLYAVWLAAYLIVSRVTALDLGKSHAPFWCYLTFTQNWIMGFAGRHDNYWLDVSWSLAVEEQFYLCLPVLVALMSRRALRALLISVLVLMPVIRIAAFGFFHIPLLAAFVLPVFRGDGLALGVLLALVVRDPQAVALYRQHRRAIMLFAIGAGVYLFAWLDHFKTTNPNVPHLLTPVTLLCGLLLFEAVTAPDGLPARLVAIAPLRFFGRISYCLYLVHVAVMPAVIAWSHQYITVAHSLDEWMWWKLTCAVVALAISIGICLVSEKWLELPARAWINRRFSSRRPLSSAAGPSATLPPQRPSSVACTSDSGPAFQRSA